MNFCSFKTYLYDGHVTVIINDEELKYVGLSIAKNTLFSILYNSRSRAEN